jgi:hypothetical protein
MEGRGPAARMPRRHALGRQARAHRFGSVLLLVLGYACFQVATPDAAWARFLTILLSAAVLLAAVWATGAQRLVARGAAAAAVVVAATAAVYLAVTGSVPLLLGAIANGLLVAIAPAIIGEGIVRNVRREQAVTLHTLSGVLAIYLLAGMFFSFLFVAVDAVDHGRFFAETSTPSAPTSSTSAT